MFTDAPIGVIPRPPAARRRSEETWAAAREAYLGGQSAPEVCARFDVGLSALRQRAAAENWRRSDQADPEPRASPGAVSPEALDDDPPLGLAEMAELSRKRARRAMLEGSVLEAERWTRVHERWRRLAEAEAAEALRVAQEAETPEDAFARGVARRDHDDRLTALLNADYEARRAAESVDGEREGETAGEADDLHEVHDLHADPEAKSAPGTPNRRRRRALARLEAYKARQSARGPPP